MKPRPGKGLATSVFIGKTGISPYEESLRPKRKSGISPMKTGPAEGENSGVQACGGSMRACPSMYGRSTSGISIEPSGCW